MAPWWWFPCKPKHVGAVLLILKYFNISMFFNVVCISWKLTCWILLMHGVTMILLMHGVTMKLTLCAIRRQWLLSLILALVSSFLNQRIYVRQSDTGPSMILWWNYNIGLHNKTMTVVLPVLLLADPLAQKKERKKYYIPSTLRFEFSLSFWFLNRELVTISPPPSSAAIFLHVVEA